MVQAAPVLAPARTSGALAVAVASGGLVAVQSRLNGELRLALHDAVLTAVVSFGTGLLLLVAAVAARPAARAALARVRAVPWWTRTGGLGGAALVAVAAAAAPELGVALLTVGLVAGQTTGGVLVDSAGLGPGGRRAPTPARLGGAALCLVAVGLTAVGDRGRVAPLLLVLVLLAGFLTSVQQALNGRVREATGDASVATLLNFGVGTTALVLGLLAHVALAGAPAADWPGPSHAHLYLGGALGATFVGVAAVVVRTLGVLRLGLAVVAGQLVGAVLLDLLAPLPGATVRAATVVAAALTLLAAGVSGRGARA